ncbi:hypothetical protein AU476_06860 [Cupriavidus sp. UYMSc13B]|nr:hypothetical protein AU476_06840 [Cupriavidus sp. UYMSc13B]RWA55487.1 hypothetical protein AU476_06860 [Cupriavidus sp. UYMSc13B]
MLATSATSLVSEYLGLNDVDQAASDRQVAYLQRTLRGIDRLFIAHGNSLEPVANEIALIDAAVASGVRHIVKLPRPDFFPSLGTCRCAFGAAADRIYRLAP